ncbi:MAG: polysaccharide deacetylase family protein [Pseudonocardia sp.]|nr:polysaccharide deacetylase family protein [Pseudonocardia sp.]MBO0874616.1 polysaccharide deacetylase family protein [Pseudonocardia sp.]
MSAHAETWPTGQRLAVTINVMYERWSPGAAPGIGPVGNPLPAGATDYQALSWSDYGHRTGIWRLLDLLAQFQVHASVYPSGILAETAPDTLKAVVDAGHELCGHGWSQDVIASTLEEDDERALIDRSVRALESVAGRRPAGWISPRCTPSAITARLLAEAGFRWFGDVFDTDLPYLIDTAAGPIVGLPFDLDVNDMPLHVRYGQPHRALGAAFHDTLDGMRTENRKAYLDVTVHAHIGARPAGRAALRRILEHLRDSDDCWVATRGELAATVPIAS